MDNEIAEYRVRLLKFDDNYCDNTRAVNEKREPPRNDSSAQDKNCEKVYDKNPEASRALRIVAGKTFYRAERKRRPNNQIEEKCVEQVQLQHNNPIILNKPKSTVFQFPTKRKTFYKCWCRGFGPTKK